MLRSQLRSVSCGSGSEQIYVRSFHTSNTLENKRTDNKLLFTERIWCYISKPGESEKRGALHNINKLVTEKKNRVKETI